MVRLDGKVAFVTGAARGQGRAHAVRLAREGADIVISDVCAPVAGNVVEAASTAQLDETAELVAKEGAQVLSRVVDVRDAAALELLALDAVDEFGRLDIVVANAAIMGYGRAWEIPLDDWDAVIAVNLTGVFKTLRATVPPMIECGNGGSIILISSAAGLKGLPLIAHYAAAKHGVVGICRTFANELGEHRIRVNSVHPGAVETPMGALPGLHELLKPSAATLGPIFMNTLPYDRIEPEAIADAVAWLASDEAKYVTGAQIPVDLGNTNR